MKTTTLFALLLISSPVFANTDARIAALEARITYLEKRIELLERTNQRTSPRTPIYYTCSLSVFGNTYEFTERNQGLARQKVRQACRAKEDAIFCQDHAVSCQSLR